MHSNSTSKQVSASYLHEDLSGLFDWNTNLVFVFITMEYENKNSVMLPIQCAGVQQNHYLGSDHHEKRSQELSYRPPKQTVGILLD